MKFYSLNELRDREARGLYRLLRENLLKKETSKKLVQYAYSCEGEFNFIPARLGLNIYLLENGFRSMGKFYQKINSFLLKSIMD